MSGLRVKFKCLKGISYWVNTIKELNLKWTWVRKALDKTTLCHYRKLKKWAEWLEAWNWQKIYSNKTYLGWTWSVKRIKTY